MHYMIHACPNREWYVNDYLVPSMIRQGIKKNSIKIWVDRDGKGNLFSTMDSFAECGKHKGSTWHLQDDAIISKDFFERTKNANENHIICGFCGKDLGPDSSKIGKVENYEMWWSFLCIHIPNKFAGECAKWFYEDAINRDRNGIQERVLGRKSDDWFWKKFIRECHPYTDIYNLKPNLVDHIDYLLGGSVINPKRTRDTRAVYFEDKDLINELEKHLEVTDYG